MSKPRRDRHYLADILEAMQRIIAYTENLSYKQFLDDRLVQDAVLRNFQVIGEATKKVSTATRSTYPELPWREMAGMRNRIVHEYFGINQRVVWDVAVRDLPRLVPRVEEIIQQLAAEAD
jgi:uncharacterized protein with HEPN domain